MQTIKINEIDYNYCAQGYNELSPKQMYNCMRMLNDNTGENQLRALYSLLRLKMFNFWKPSRMRLKNIAELPPEWVHTLLTDKDLFGWLADKPDLSQFLLPKIKVGFKFYYAPVKRMLNVTAAEVVYGYTFFKQYSQTEDNKYIDKLCALLYREKNPWWWLKKNKPDFNGDVRKTYNDYSFEKRCKVMAKLDNHIKLCVFLQFASAWAAFQDRKEFKFVFPKGQEEEKGKSDPFAWQKIMMKMAESGVFGTYKQVENMDADTFFLKMQANIEEWIERKDAK